MRSLQFEQPPFDAEPSSEAAKLSVRPYHAMTRNDDGNWIAVVCCSYRTRRAWPTHCFGYLPVSPGFSVGNLLERPPNGALEIRSCRR